MCVYVCESADLIGVYIVLWLKRGRYIEGNGKCRVKVWSKDESYHSIGIDRFFLYVYYTSIHLSWYLSYKIQTFNKSNPDY